MSGDSMFQWVQVIGGQIVNDWLPRSLKLAGNMAVSNARNLTAADLAQHGWLPVDDAGPPSPDFTTRTVELHDGVPVAVYTAGPPLPPPSDPPVDGHHDPLIGAPDA